MSVGGKQVGSPNVDGNRPSQNDDSEYDPLSKNEKFHLLQTERRRYVLRYLSETTGSVDLRELSERIAAWEHGTSVESLTSSQRQRVYISLYQTHLPKLDKHGLIEYDKNRGTVKRRGRADSLEPYLDVPARNPDPWPHRYGATAIVCLLFLGGAGTQDVVSHRWIATIVLLAFGLVTVAHLWTSEYV